MSSHVENLKDQVFIEYTDLTTGSWGPSCELLGRNNWPAAE